MDKQKAIDVKHYSFDGRDKKDYKEQAFFYELEISLHKISRQLSFVQREILDADNSKGSTNTFPKLQEFFNDTKQTVDELQNMTIGRKEECREKVKIEQDKMLEDVAGHVITFVDQEKKKVSNILYHTVSQTLYSLTLGLNMVQKISDNPDAKKLVSEIIQSTNNLLNEIKTLSLELHPFLVEDLGFVPAVRSLVREVEKTENVTVNINLKGIQERISFQHDLMIYRILQDIFNLIKKFKKTLEINILVQLKDEKVHIHVKGNIFQEYETSKELYQRMLVIKERVIQSNGFIDAKHDFDKREFTVNIELPLEQ